MTSGTVGLSRTSRAEITSACAGLPLLMRESAFSDVAIMIWFLPRTISPTGFGEIIGMGRPCRIKAPK